MGDREYDRRRGTAAQRGYGTDWRKLRREILRRDPVCRMQGCSRQSSHVDHIVPRRKGGTDDPSNLQGLCGSCHNSAKQSLERSGYLRGHDASGLPLDAGHHWRE